MKPTELNQKGFSLVELIAALILMGFVGAIAGMGIVQIMDGFMFLQSNTETVQKGQIAMSRIVKEFQEIRYIPDTPSPTGIFIRYSRSPVNPADLRTLAYSSDAGTLTLDGEILVDNVHQFSLDYYETYDALPPSPTDPAGGFTENARLIEIRLEMEGPDSTVAAFTNRVFLRNLES